MHSGYLNDGVAEAQHQRHSYRMTEEGGFRREVTAKTQPDITQSVRAVISELISSLLWGSARACSDSIVASWASMARKLFSKIPVF